MAGVKWSQFPAASSVNSNDEVVGLQSGVNKRISVSTLITAMRQGLANIFVPLTRTVNGQALSSDITLTASDVGAVPTSRTVNNKALSSDITLTASDVGARADNWTPSAADVGAQPAITAAGILKGDGSGGVTAATAGTDYQAPLVAGTDYATPADVNTSMGFWLDCGTISSLPVTITDSRVTANHSTTAHILGDRLAVGNVWTITTAAGQVTISGTVSATTTLKLWLEPERT